MNHASKMSLITIKIGYKGIYPSVFIDCYDFDPRPPIRIEGEFIVVYALLV
jgi:hypothetical protein